MPSTATSRLVFVWIFPALALLTASQTTGQIEKAEFQSGLVAVLQGENDRTVTRVDPAIAFNWSEQSPDSRLKGEQFSGTWRGFLKSGAAGKHRLFVFAAGQVRIKLNDQVVVDGESARPQWFKSKQVDLPFGRHSLNVAFRKTSPHARLALFWSGPNFGLEPVTGRNLTHKRDASPDQSFARGRLLARALRCAACHSKDGESAALSAPALDKLTGNISQRWLTDWLLADGHKIDDKEADAQDPLARRMPAFELSKLESEQIAAYLLRETVANKKQEKPPAKKADPKSGQRLFLTLGCLACHTLGEHGTSGLFDGGDLSLVARKRPERFFARWLASPEQTNRDHRMPVFELNAKERSDLAAFLSGLHGGKRPDDFSNAVKAGEDFDAGRKLVETYRCGACHQLPADAKAPPRSNPLKADSNWKTACTAEAGKKSNKPSYRLAQSDRAVVKQYFSSVHHRVKSNESSDGNQLLLAENNCLACHARGGSTGIASKHTTLVKAHSSLETVVPAMSPPPLDSVGDKLNDEALAGAIGRSQKARREWLLVRMPRFRLTDDELQRLVQLFVNADRIPDGADPRPKEPPLSALRVAGRRLVTPNGFGCTSCHQVGDVMPPDAPLNARGADLSMLGKRIRRQWFDRWVRNPARIVPRMEMPSVQFPVRGVLGEKLDHQLAAVWHVLNEPGFQPPQPNPVRVVRRSGIRERKERAAILTDVLRVGDKKLIKPFLIGFPNRHSALFDLESDRFTGWWIGDVARQRTEGKTWFWESAGAELMNQAPGESELSIVRGDEVYVPRRVGQFVTEADQWRHMDGKVRFGKVNDPKGGVLLDYRLVFRGDGEEQIVTKVREHLTPIWPDELSQDSGWRREIYINNGMPDSRYRLQILNKELMKSAKVAEFGRVLSIGDGTRIRVIDPPDGRLRDDGSLLSLPFKDNHTDVFRLEYITSLPVDQFPITPPKADPPDPVALNVVPGFEATRLPLGEDIMPTALAWKPDGTLAVASLKGRVWLARDTNNDELEDELQAFSDELAAPFGISALPSNGSVVVINKFGLLHLRDINNDGRHDETVTWASGWGHTADYHDWAVGLPRDKDGNYYIALACQQDKRSDAAAHLRGKVLKLTRRKPGSEEDSHPYYVPKVVSGGHRFPIGIALNRDGELFVSDNQGNFNPFNELNHVIPGARYGFINALERKKDFKPKLTPPAINLPHPWTRSVNGICFLFTPEKLKEKLGREVFGPFEGHLIGCEYDTRRLIRMSLQRVGDIYQGAAYPFSYDKPKSGPPLLGPLCCAVAPDGDLYVGNIRDSGWGGANNVGSLVRLRPRPSLPPGIAEVRATNKGFNIDFATPVDADRAADTKNYAISSYTRVSTPAYGGPDVKRRGEKITDVKLAENRRQVSVTLPELREGFVYEIHVKNIARGSAPFYPAEAHYTLRKIPD